MSSDERRFAELEERVAQLERDLQEVVAADRIRSDGGVVSPPLPPPQGQPVTVAPVVVVPRRSNRRNPVRVEVAFTWVGVVLVVLAVGFAVSTAISRGWVGPVLQLVGAVGLSFALMSVGVLVRVRFPRWGTALACGGVGGLYATGASSLFDNQAGTTAAMLVVPVAAAIGVALMMVIRSPMLVAVVVLGGLTAHLVVNDRQSGSGWAVVALVVLVAAARLVVGLRGEVASRVALHGCGLVVVAVASGLAEQFGAEVFAGVGAAALMGSLLFAGRGEVRVWIERAEVQLLAITGMWAVVVVSLLLDAGSRFEVGVIAGGVALGWFVIVAVTGQFETTRRIALLISGSSAMSLAVILLLSGALGLLGLAVQGLGLMAAARFVGWDRRLAVNGAILFGVVALMVFVDGINGWFEELPVAENVFRTLAVGVLSGAVLLVPPGASLRRLALSLPPLAMVSVAALLVHGPQGQAVVSATWAAMGGTAFLVGVSRRLPHFGVVGLAMLGVTVAKLLVVDMDEVEALWRALLFLVVGLGLIRLGLEMARLNRSKSANQ